MFFFFAVSVSWILVNVLLTIIIDGYEKVKKELEGQKNDLEVIQYIKVSGNGKEGYLLITFIFIYSFITP